MKTVKTVRVLGIETSCDETAISLIEIDDAGRNVNILGNTVHSQIDVHTPYGGVFPTLAKREHQRNLVPVLEKTLAAAGMLERATENKALRPDIETILEKEHELLEAFRTAIPTIKKPDIDLISVTVGPGLEPALWVGINFARALGTMWDMPVVPVNHMEGHILAALIRRKEGSHAGSSYSLLSDQIDYPALSLLISGGHTQIVLIKRLGSYRIVGETLDDAIGECFDKIARTLGLTYPGGPKISKLAGEARMAGIESPEPLPRPMIDSKDLNFSFSGLKTAVLYLTRRIKLDDTTIKGICREAEDAITDVIVLKIRKAVEMYSVETLIIGGGVIANARIREALEKLASDCSLALLMPETGHSTDNGLMIALAGYFNRDKATSADVVLTANGTLALGPRG